MSSKRLEAVKSLVPIGGCVVADIGTDHAQLPIELLQEGRCSKAYACDIAEGPLSYAKKNIDKAKLKGKVIPILSDGLDNVPDDADVIVIAGMGYFTVEEILENAIVRLYKCQRVIVQVNTDVIKLREWISAHHFTIENEILVYDRHYYTAIQFSTNYHASYGKLHQMFGPVLLHERSDLFIDYCQQTLDNYKEIKKAMSRKNPRYNGIANIIQIYETIIEDKPFKVK